MLPQNADKIKKIGEGNMKKKKIQTVDLYTEYESELKNEAIPFSEYPRPQLKRDSYLCLNGYWDFSIRNNKPCCRICS